MAFLDVHAFSDVLGLQVSFYVLLPQQTTRQIGVDGGTSRAAYPVLWLLHGLSDDHTIWLRRTGVERYAAERNLAVVMPAVGRSFYQDTVGAGRYWTFLSEELPGLCRAWFPLSAKREDNFVAGLSMGGYGALRLALAKPERFAAAASFSGALDLPRRLRTAGKPGSRFSREEWVSIFGPKLDVTGTDAELTHLATGLAKRPVKPKLYLSCGTEDELLPETREFHQHLEKVGVPHTYSEGPGNHEWRYWDQEIQKVINWLPISPGSAA